MKTNKEIIDALQIYFLNQKPEVVSRALAAMMIDLNRFFNIESLEEDEKSNLFFRLHANNLELRKFIEKGGSSDLKLHNIESK